MALSAHATTAPLRRTEIARSVRFFRVPLRYASANLPSPLLLDRSENHSPSPFIAFLLPLSNIEHALFVVLLPFRFNSSLV